MDWHVKHHAGIIEPKSLDPVGMVMVGGTIHGKWE